MSPSCAVMHIYDETEPDVSRELETSLSFTLHLG